MAKPVRAHIAFSCQSSLANRLSVSSAPRLYHSAAQAQPSTFSPTEATILSAALKHVPSHGFSRSALIQGARDAGYLDVSTNLFPGGAFDLIRYHLVTQRQLLKERVHFDESDGKRVGLGKKIKELAWARLKANAEAEVLGRWSEALAIMAQPSFAPAALKELALLSDEMWHLAGDKDVSFAWYSKRASLSAVYASSELFMTQDASSGFRDTESFLERRLREVQSAGATVGSVGEWAGFSASALVNVLRSKGIRI